MKFLATYFYKHFLNPFDPYQHSVFKYSYYMVFSHLKDTVLYPSL